MIAGINREVRADKLAGKTNPAAAAIYSAASGVQAAQVQNPSKKQKLNP